MSDRAPARRARLPLLDLLREDEEAAAGAGAWSADQTEQLRAAVLRDLEALLNARRRRRPPPAGLHRLARSPVGYGIPDVTAGAYALESRRFELAREVEETIRRFEPRLADLSVAIRDPGSEVDRTLRLRIEAVLLADPVREAISFEAVVEPAAHDARVREV
jgi:type VI secretion system protein ImpF